MNEKPHLTSEEAWAALEKAAQEKYGPQAHATDVYVRQHIGKRTVTLALCLDHVDVHGTRQSQNTYDT